MEDRVLLSSSVMVGYVGSYGVIASGRGVGLCGRMCSGNGAGFRLGRSLWWDDGRVESRGKEIERVRCRGEVRMSAMPMKADAEVMEKRAQEELQKRLEESRERVSLLMGKLIIREAEENISRAEKQTIQSYPREKTGLQVTETYLENLQDIKADLERSMKDLELLKPEHGGVVDATKTIQRTTELYNTVASICSRIEEEPASTDEGEEPSPKLPPLEEVRKKVLNVGQGLEKSVGAFVREDGSIDFPGIRSAAQMSLDKGAEVWARLNGVTPEGASFRQAYEDSPVMWSLRTEIETLEKRLSESSRAREQSLRKEDQLGKLVKAREFREMDDRVSTIRRNLAVRVLELEMERIFLYLQNEGDTTDDFMEERLLVTDFGQLDERLAVLKVFLDENQVLLLDDDELGELAGDITFLKSRVGLENDFYTTTMDWPKAKRVLSEGFGKMKEGGEFFWRGLRLLGGDIVYAFRLIRKAAIGSILTPREVRTLRRTGRDIITFIPFSIILIAPLTPIGHVLVFSFIQRFFPDFFPTTFSERRQRLMKRYETMRVNLSSDNTDNSENSASSQTTRSGKSHPRVTNNPLQKTNKLYSLNSNRAIPEHNLFSADNNG